MPLGPKRIFFLMALALVLTVLNSLQPLAIDDGTYYLYARQIASNPLDPYGGVILLWGPKPRDC